MGALAKKAPAGRSVSKEKAGNKSKKKSREGAVSGLAQQLLRRAEKLALPRAPRRAGHLSVVGKEDASGE